MAVYTSVNQFEIKEFLSQYNLGKFISYEGIIEGIENTNFKITTEKGNFVLTIFEKRVDPNDLPFFINLQKFLSSKGFPCPIPIQNNNKIFINSLFNKKSVISSFLNGKQIESPIPEHCFEVGKMISKFQQITQKFKQSRLNNLDIDKWLKIFSKCLDVNNHNYHELLKFEVLKFLHLEYLDHPYMYLVFFLYI